MKKMRKFLSIVMAAAMALTMAIPASAAQKDNLTISIDNEKAGYQYTAYQVFDGDIEDGANGKVLTNIEWGTGIDVNTLLQALKDNEVYEGAFDDCNSAAAVAKVLGELGASHVDDFAKDVANHLNESAGIASVDGQVNPYQINVQKEGYYFVKDTKIPDPNGAHVKYILEVVEDTRIKPKTVDVPDVDKEIVEDGEHKGNDYEIGDEVTFTLTATLPENYKDFDAYTLIFHDTLTEGLTFNPGSVTVKKENATANYSKDEDYTLIEDPEDTCTFEVEFDDLVTTDPTLEPGDKIIVTYTATLNKKAEISTDDDNFSQNKNEVKLEYSNDPNNDGTGFTTPDEVYVYTYGLELTKIDGDAEPRLPLSGAEFKLYSDADCENQIFFDKQADGVYMICDGSECVTANHTGTLIVDANGKLILKGLDNETYYLKETKAPNGYNEIKEPIEVKITSAIADDGKLIDLDVKVTIGNDVTDNQGDLDSGIVSIDVENHSGSQLPETGGMGTTLFTVGGAALMLFAVVLLVTKKKMADR